MGDDKPAEVQWLRAKQAAKRIGVSRWTVPRRAEGWSIRSRIFPTGKGGERRYHSGDVQRLIDRIARGEFVVGEDSDPDHG